MSKSLLMCLGKHAKDWTPDEIEGMSTSFKDLISAGMSQLEAGRKVVFDGVIESEDEIAQIEQVIESHLAKKREKGEGQGQGGPEKVAPGGAEALETPKKAQKVQVPAQLLKKAGLVVTETLTKPKKAGKKPRPVWEVAGRIDPFVEIIRDLGGRKWGGKYSFWDDPTEALAEAIQEQGGMSFAEQMGAKETRAEEKADRLEDRAGKARGKADAARKAEDRMAEHIPMGQPILVGHHSEKRARRDQERIQKLTRDNITESDKAEWLEDRVKLQRDVAKGEYTIRFMQNRVDESEADVRRLERILSGEHYGGEALKNDQYRERITRNLADAQEKVDYWKSGIEAAGGIAYSKENVSKGDRVKIRGAWCVVERANPKTVSIIVAEGGAKGMKLKYKYSEIQKAEIEKPVEEKPAAKEVEKPAEKAAIPETAPKKVAAPLDKKQKAKIVSLRKGADNLQKQIDEKRDPAVASQNLTARRARQASSMSADADWLERTQMVMRGLADDTENGTLPEMFMGIGTKAQIDQILKTKNFSYPGFHKSRMSDLIEAVKGVKGLASERMAIADMSRRVRHSEYQVDLRTIDEIKAVEAAIRQKPGTLSRVKEGITEGKRLIALNIRNQVEYVPFRDKLYEYVNPPDPVTQTQAKIREKEAALIGVKIPGFFPTPAPVGALMVEAADIQPGDYILEPSAGKGDLAVVIKEAHPDNPMQVAEIGYSMREILELKGFDIIGVDFLDMVLSKPGVQGLDIAYDKIIQNPPFENFQDIDHIYHAYELLAPGGRLVSLTSESPFFRSEKKAVEFREWLDKVGAENHKLEDKSFTGAEAFRQTGVSARMVIIDKPGKKAPQMVQEMAPKPWGKEFPNVISHTNANKVETHPDHKAAKKGDTDAAIRLVDVLFKPERAKALAVRHPGSILVAIHSEEAAGKNKIPQAFAEAIGSVTGLGIDTGIVQTNVTAHTGKNGLQRLLARAKFTGKVEKGRDYIILDDVITQGGTVSELKQYIEREGGNVVEVVSLACAQFANTLAVNEKTVNKLIDKYGRIELESILKENGIPARLESLTQSEARQLALYKGPDSLRTAIAKERQEAGIAKGETLFSKEVRKPVTYLRPWAYPSENDVEQAKKGLKILKDTLSKVIPADLMERIEVKASPIIKYDLTKDDAQRSLAEHGGTLESISGMTTINEFNALVEIAYKYENDFMESTSYHEAFHVATKWLLPAQDYKNLMKYFKGNEEDAANAFSGFAMGLKGKELNIHPNFIKAIFLKLRRYFQMLRNALQGRGFARPEDVFGKLVIGQYKVMVPESVIRSRLRLTPEQTHYAKVETPADPMYSQLVKAVETAKDMPRKVPSLLKWLQKKAKPEEIKWLDAEEWLSVNVGKDGKIDKDQFLAYLKDHQISIHEMVRYERGSAFPDELQWSTPEFVEPPQLDEDAEFEELNLDPFEDLWDTETYAVDGPSQDVYTIIGNVDVGYNLFLELDGSNEKQHLGRGETMQRTEGMANDDLSRRYTFPEARYEGQTIEGGADYKELLFTYPPRSVKNNFKVIRSEGKFQIKDTMDDVLWPTTSPWGFFYDTFQEAQAKVIDLNWEYHKYGIEAEPNFYRSSHWEETNVLAHSRFKSRRDSDGRKVLFIEEVQSDWHQTGQEIGYKGDDALEGPRITIEPNTGQLGDAATAKYWAVSNGVILGGGLTESEARIRGQEILENAEDERLIRPPRAPFGKTWHEYVMKRLLRWAAENGFDTLAWTTGKQQIRRYDLRHHVDLITWQSTGIDIMLGTTVSPRVNIRAFYKGEQKLHRKVGIMTQLDNLLGKNMANQIRAAINRRETEGNIEPKDMTVGGRGMESFYDELIPGFMRKYGKQWGATVGQTKIVTGRQQDVSNYTGPDYDIKTLRDILEIQRELTFPMAYQDKHALQMVIGTMNEFGTSFKVAMMNNGTAPLAEMLKGELAIAYVDVTEDAHSIDITPAMREAVVYSGQTMFEGKKEGAGQAWAQQFIADALADAADNPKDKKAQAKAKRIRVEQEWFNKEWPRAAYESTKAVIKAFKMGKKKGWSGMKPDTTFLERWLQTPEFYYKKVPAAWRVFMASLERQDNYNQFYSDLTNKDELLAEIQTFKKADPREYTRLGKLLIRADQIKATHGPKSLRELGFSDQAITAFLAFRQMMDNGFDALYAEMAKIIEEYEEAGLDLPEVATWVGDKEVVVNLKFALAQMGSMRGFYFPRQRKSGNWMLVATKKGENPVMEIFETYVFANVRGDKLEAQGYEVSKTATKELPEDVFQLAGKTIGLNAMINLALSKTIPEKMPTFEEYGLTPIMRTGPTGRKDFIVRGPTNKKTNAVMKGMGGRLFSAAAGEPKAWHFFDAPSDMQFRVLRALITAKGIPGAAESDLLFAHALATEVANVVKGRGFRTSMVARRPETGSDVWVGYDTDPIEVASRYVTGLASGLAKKEVASKMVQAMTGTDVKPQQFESFEDYLDEVQHRRIDPAKQKNIFHDTTKYVQEMLRNQEFSDRVIGVIKGATVLKYLGFRLASPLVNLTALVTSVPATMHGLAGVPSFKTLKYLGNAFVAYNTYARGDKSTLAPDIVEMFDHIQLKGWDNAQYNMEALAVLRSKLGNKWKWTMEKSMYMFGATEQLNRVATIMGTYMALKDQGNTNFSEMRDLAKSVSDRSHGTYGRTTYPYIALGKNPAAQAAQCLYVFSKFSHTYLQNMYDLGYKRHEWQSLLWMAFAPAILAGAGSVPFIWPLLMSSLRGIFDADQPEETFYSWFDDNFGEFIGNIARYGVAGFGGYGISLKGSLAIDPVESFPTRLPEIFGAPGNVVTDLWDGGKSLFKGDVFGAAQKMGPRVTGSMMQAYNEERYGVRTRTKTPKFINGKKMEPENLDSILRFLNFNPAHMAKIKEQKWSQQRLVTKYRDLRSDLYGRVRAYYHKPQARRSRREYLDLLADIDEYNKRVQLRKLYEIKGISVITKQTIKTALKLKK